MSSDRPSRRAKWVWLAVALVVIGTIASLRYVRDAGSREQGSRELRRSELTLRDGLLYAAGETAPFTGKFYDSYAPNIRKLEIEIRGGKAHGRSLGFYENHQLEVEETFVEGVSHGPRTRWHQNGMKRSEENIEHGQVVGRYVEWHDNGQKAVEMMLLDGKPDGLVEAWHPSGVLKSRVRFERGQQVSRQFSNDSSQAAGVTEPSPAEDAAPSALR